MPGGNGPDGRIRRRTDFQRVYREGRRWSGRWVNVFSLAGRAEALRFGITVTKKTGGAVVRNRIRRQIREILREARPSLPGGSADVIVHVRPGPPGVEFAPLRDEIRGLLRRALPPRPRPDHPPGRSPATLSPPQGR